jgi:N,N-dimethylformamidase
VDVVGYSDPWSVEAGQSIAFMVSCTEPTFDAQVVRLVHGDLDPAGPGYREEEIAADLNGTHRGRAQELRPGSFALVENTPPLTFTGSFSLALWVYATAPGYHAQTLAAKWSSAEGFSLELDETGRIALAVPGTDDRVVIPAPVREATWYRVGLSFEARSSSVRLLQRPARTWPRDDTRCAVVRTVVCGPSLANHAPLTFAARPTADGTRMEAFYDGKLGGVALYDRALDDDELADGVEPAPVARWHFGLDAASDHLVETGESGVHGRVVNMPARGVTGVEWRGYETHFLRAPDEYDAIHFHRDDLDDARWEPSLQWHVPGDCRSGIYALRLRAGSSEDHVPFFVRPPTGHPRSAVAFLAPTFSYLAYANEHYMSDPSRQETLDFDIEATLARATLYEREHYLYARNHGLLSLYDAHADGSGTCYASRLRPQVNMRPKYNWPSLQFEAPHQLNQDLYLVDWLEQKSLDYDVVTDEDLHHEGSDLLAPYRVVITGSHPEYWTAPMLEALETYLQSGGRLMYLGGNGFYWVTSVDPDRPHVIEIRRGEAGTRIWQAAAGEYHHSTTGEVGGLWRYRNRPPQQLVGVGLTAQGYDRASPYRRLQASHDPCGAFVFDGVEGEIVGDGGLHLGGAAGYELDRAEPELGTPPHALRLAESFGHSDSYQHAIEEVLEMDPKQGGSSNPFVRADMVLVEYPNGGAVFSVGSISWTGSLSHESYHGDVSRITENVLRQFLRAEPLP